MEAGRDHWHFLSWDMSAASFPESRVLKYPLHNFSFPTMSWGQHRVFRCVNSIAETGLSGAVPTGMERQKDTHCGKSNTRPTAGCSEKDAAASTAATAAAAATVPWNLRKRRAACFSPGENDRSRYPSISPSHWQFPERVDLKSGGQRQRPKFSVSLSREEIEGDFYVFMGMKPPRRPQKRPRIVQRKLDDLFPGLWLEEVTLDSY